MSSDRLQYIYWERGEENHYKVDFIFVFYLKTPTQTGSEAQLF